MRARRDDVSGSVSFSRVTRIPLSPHERSSCVALVRDARFLEVLISAITVVPSFRTSVSSVDFPIHFSPFNCLPTYLFLSSYSSEFISYNLTLPIDSARSVSSTPALRISVDRHILKPVEAARCGFATGAT
jgi:hypothetical protein